MSERPPGESTTQLLEALVASAPDALYVVDADGRIRLLNPAALRVLGYSDADELLGRPSHATIHHSHPDGSAFAEADCPLLAPRLTGETVRVERDWFVRADGSFVPVAYASAPLDTGEGRGAIVSFRDIGEQLRAEQVLLAQTAREAHLAEVQASRTRLVAAAEEERRRLARDLHDGAQQHLVQGVIELGLAQRAAGELPAAAAEHLAQALAATQAAIAELRELAQGIHPRVLSDRGLPAALAALADRAPWPVELEAPAERFPEAVEAAVYFLVAEALTNAAKHANAEGVRVRVEHAGAVLRVEISDDGGGGAAVGAGSGLRGLEDRLAAIGGALSVESDAASGTTLRATLPLDG